MLNNFLSKTDFYSISGLTESELSNPGYVDFLISKFNALVAEVLSPLFSLQTNQKFKYYRKQAQSYILTGNWLPSGVIEFITITNGGSGYTSTPTVQFSTGNARATAIVTSGVVTGINIDYRGEDYATAPIISFVGGGGINAAATATLSSLTVKLGQDGSTELSDLTKGDDYREILFPETQNPYDTLPVVAIKLYDLALELGEYLQIEGTYGFSNGVPDGLMLDMALYEIMKKAVLSSENETESGGKGVVSSASIDKVSVSFKTNSNQEGDLSTARKALQAAKETLYEVVNSYTINQGLLPSLIG